MKVGYIGLGNIGAPSAAHLIREGFDAHVYDIDESAVAALAARGARACASAGELAARCEHIGLCVRDELQVEELLYGDEGLLQRAQPGSLIAVHSTVSDAALKKWANDAGDNGIALIDAAISGGAQGAEQGSLCYMVGGPTDAVERARPVFDTSAERVIHAGDIGAGMLLKLCNNLITYAQFLAMSEATRLAEAGGLSADLLREVGESNGVVSAQMHSFIVNRNALAAQCSAEDMDKLFGSFGRLGEKDLDCALQSAADLAVTLPSTQRLRDVVLDLFLNKA